MFSLELFTLGFFANAVSQAICENYVNHAETGLKRHAGQKGVAYANFAVHKFRYLNITPLASLSVSECGECCMNCLLHSSCYSFNKAVFRDNGEKILCELLPSDKYNKSSKFLASHKFHHYSIEKKTPCKSNPCKNGANCLAKYEDNDYQCTCAPEYTGKNCEIGFPTIHWKLDGADTYINLHGGAKFNEQDGRTVLYLDGSQGTFADTPAFPLHSTNLTIAVWIKLMVQSHEPMIYGDWSFPHPFRFFIESNGRLCAQIRDVSGGYLINDCTGLSDVIPDSRWSHVVMTWNRASRTMKLFINGEMRLERTVAAYRNLDVMNSGHPVYDIGLKRDSGTVAHAYYSDLMIFDREFLFWPSQNVNEIKDGIFVNHPLYSFT